MKDIQKLKDIKDEAQRKLSVHSNEVKAKLEQIICNECSAIGVTPFFSHSFQRGWHDELCLSTDIGFIDDGGKLVFGAGFTLCVYQMKATVNRGTIGTYSLEDRFQVARDRLIARIWDIHDELIKEVGRSIEPELFDAAARARFEHEDAAKKEAAQ